VIRDRPAHPYTRALLAAEPPHDRRLATIPTIPGSVPRHDDVADRCPFADRCAFVTDACRSGRPALGEHDGRQVACVRVDAVGTADFAPAEVSAPTGRDDRGPALLAVDGLVKTYRGSSVPALDGVSLTVAAGESVGIVGESGSGKTTLARCVVGLETPESGVITFDGQDITDWRSLDGGRRRELRRAVQMVFQDPYSTLNPVRSVGATLREALGAMGQPAARADVGRLLTLVGLPEGYAAKRPASLSGGERQRVSIARALAGRPSLMVCDESVSALDVSVQAQILDLLSGLQRELGMALLFITHDLAVVRQVTDTVYVLHDGACVEHGPTADVLDDPQDEYTRALLSSVPREDRDWLTS
jgi:peptide/nickel transport system ATP-binding protein